LRRGLANWESSGPHMDVKYVLFGSSKLLLWTLKET
jgi:hypothetical protein